MQEYFSPELVAVIIGALLTLATTLIVNRKDYESALEREIAKERVANYQKIYKIISELNIYYSPSQSIVIPKNCFLRKLNTGSAVREISILKVFMTKNVLYNYLSRFSEILNETKIYIDPNLLNQLMFLNSYISEVINVSSEKSDAELRALAFVLSNEIETLREGIENEIQKFINSNKKEKLKTTNLNGYEYSYKKRKETLLFKYYVKQKKTFGTFDECKNCSIKEKCTLLNDVQNGKF